MKESIFDLVEEDVGNGKQGYLDIAKNAPQPKEKSFLNDIKDYGKTFVKGAVEGLTRLGRMMGPLQERENTEQILENQTKYLNKVLPTDEGFGQKALRRGLNELPSAVANPWAKASSIAYPLMAGAAGQTAEELGAPEWAQSAAEISAYLTPNVTKKLLEAGKHKELIQIGRKLGISDEAMTPLLQPEFKEKWLTKLAPRRGSTQTKLGKAKEELGNVYSTIQKSPQAAKEISNEAGVKFIEDVDKLLFEMPSGVREKIKGDLKDLYKNPITGDTLINFYKDVNSEVSGNAKQLSLLKGPIKKALSSSSPEMAKDFETINDLFSKYHKVSERLKPNLMTDLIGAGEALGVFTSMATGQYPIIAHIAGEQVARRVSQQLLFNPRFQQIGLKVADALNQNKVPMLKKLSDLMSHEIRKTSPEIADKLDELKEEDFKKILESHHQSAKKTK